MTASNVFCYCLIRDAPEPTGEEADDADFDAPKIYELVRLTLSKR